MSVCGCNPPCEWPPCITCGEDHGSSPSGRCRDCDIEYSLKRMLCSGCNRMRYRTETIGTLDLGALGAALWGDRCQCKEPLPPSQAEVEGLSSS